MLIIAPDGSGIVLYASLGGYTHLPGPEGYTLCGVDSATFRDGDPLKAGRRAQSTEVWRPLTERSYGSVCAACAVRIPTEQAGLLAALQTLLRPDWYRLDAYPTSPAGLVGSLVRAAQTLRVNGVASTQELNLRLMAIFSAWAPGEDLPEDAAVLLGTAGVIRSGATL